MKKEKDKDRVKWICFNYVRQQNGKKKISFKEYKNYVAFKNMIFKKSDRSLNGAFSVDVYRKIQKAFA